MVPRYSTVAATHRPRKRDRAGHFLWYTHKPAWTDRLHRAIGVVDSGLHRLARSRCRVETPKKVVTGHGIDLGALPPGERSPPTSPPRLLSVGRLSAGQGSH